MHAGNLYNIVQCQIVCPDDSIWKVVRTIGYIVNKYFFYFFITKHLNWLLLKLLCSGYLFWLEELFESWIFLQCSPCCFCTAYVATPARSHGNSYIFYTVANLYEFVWTHSYKFIRFLLNLTYFTSCQFVGICTNDLHLTPPLSLPVTWV